MMMLLKTSISLAHLIIYVTALQSNLSFAQKSPINDVRDNFPDPATTLELAKLSQAVYAVNRTNFDPIPIQYTVIGWIDEGSTEVLILKVTESISSTQIKSDSVILSFRGTEEIADWIVNLQSAMVPFGFPNHGLSFHMVIPSTEQTFESERINEENVPILVHQGFNQMFRVYDRILEFLEPLEYDNLFVTGHSLGGANAQLFSTMYAFQNVLTTVYCTTFGQPRVGNIGFKTFVESLYNLNMWRFVNQNDIVPRVPPFLDGFTHAGHLMWNRMDQKEINENKQVNAYFRQVGSKLNGREGVNDYSLALLGPIQKGETEFLIQHHFISTMIKDWLMDLTMYASEFA